MTDPAKLPFAAVPVALLKDRSLKPADKLVAGLILEWCVADGKPCDSGWALNGVLASGAGLSARTVQRSIDALAARGWIAVADDASIRGRRRITLLWRRPGFAVPPEGDMGVTVTRVSRHRRRDMGVTQSRGIPSKKNLNKLEGDLSLTRGGIPPRESENESERDAGGVAAGWTSPDRKPARYRAVPAGTDPPPAKITAMSLEWARRNGRSDPEALAAARRGWACQSLDSIEGATDERADLIAALMARAFGDVANLPWYRHIVRESRDGAIPASDLISAFVNVAMRTNDGEVKAPGPYFAEALKTQIASALKTQIASFRESRPARADPSKGEPSR